MSDRLRQDPDLLAAYALDAVDADERDVITAELARDKALQAEVAEYHELMAILADAVEQAPSTPSPGVWSGIQASIAGERTVTETPRFTPAREARRRRFTTRFMGAVAATALVAAAFFGFQSVAQDDAELVAAANELRDAPGSEVVLLTDSGGLAVEVVVGADGIGYVFTDSLPALAADRSYQLWVINDNGVISAGIFDTDGVAPFVVDSDLAGLAITEEIAGGVVASENDPVAVWLDA